MAAADTCESPGAIHCTRYRVGNVGHLDSQRRRTIWIERDQHHRVTLAAQVDALNAFDFENSGLNFVVDDTLKIRHVNSGGRVARVHEQSGNREIPATHLDFRFFGIRWRRLGMVQGIQHVDHRLLQISADVELHIYFFLRLNDVGLDLLWCGVAPGRIDVDLGVFDVRQHLYRQSDDADDAKHHDQYRGGEQCGWIIGRQADQ